MIYIIYPSDPSTDFLKSATLNVINSIGGENVSLISCHASDDGYEKTIDEIKAIPDGAKVVFLGHSTPTTIFGGECPAYKRKPLLELSDMSIFKGKSLFVVSCFSAKLLKSTRIHRGYSPCVGFGLLPSELDELVSHNKLNKLSLSQYDIDIFKEFLCELVGKAVVCFFLNDANRLFGYVKILVNRKITEIIFSKNNLKVAEMLYYVVNEVVVE